VRTSSLDSASAFRDGAARSTRLRARRLQHESVPAGVAECTRFSNVLSSCRRHDDNLNCDTYQ
jgi:hypothetical protein